MEDVELETGWNVILVVINIVIHKAENEYLRTDGEQLDVCSGVTACFRWRRWVSDKGASSGLRRRHFRIIPSLTLYEIPGARWRSTTIRSRLAPAQAL